MPTLEQIPEPYNSAHKFSSNHREAILKLDMVGCFYCFGIYPPTEITEWCDQDQTAICPKCGIDSVLPNIDPTFLKPMHDYWFAMVPLKPKERPS